MISKVYIKISVLFELVQNLEIFNLAMTKVKKFNILVTYFGLACSATVRVIKKGTKTP
jgi:hypothetical protein